MIKIIIPLFAFLLLLGCGDSSSSAEQTVETKKVQPAVEVLPEEQTSDDFFDFDFGFDWPDWFSSDKETESEEEIRLSAQLTEAALNAESPEAFAIDGLDMAVVYVIDEYFPDFMSGMLHDSRMATDGYLNPKNLVESSTSLYDYMIDFYNTAVSLVTAPQLRSVELRAEEFSIIELIINEIYNIIMGWFWPSDTADVPVLIDPSEMIDPTQDFDFNLVSLPGKVFYVASATYMTITIDETELTGRGEIGFGIGEDFTYNVSSDGIVTIDMAGLYTVNMTYLDKDYCIAVEMLDHETDELYTAYWFSDEATYEKASNMKDAEAQCFIRKQGYSAPVVAVDGILEPIKDERAGHAPVSGTSTSNIVEQLVSGIDRVATVEDAKYFARKMRHGIFSIYTTNEQTHTLQATETEKVMRELLPLAASSGIGFEEMMSGAYDSTLAFQDEVNRDLNDSMTESSARFDEIILATSQAMDRTTSENSYHGVSDTTSFGDIVDFKAENIQLSCGLAFFLCNEATADVTMKMTNPANNNRDADVVFTTKIQTSIIGNSGVNFSQVDSSQTNYISGADYRLNITDFNYQRANGLMTIKGNGSMGSASRLIFDNYEILATFEENPDLKLLKFTASVDGSITTAAGRKFDGVLFFDGDNTSNSQMDGVLIGINAEPRIEGFVKTSLNYDDVEGWYTANEGAQGSTIESIGDQSYTMEVLISKMDRKVSANVLVQRDDAADKWFYNMQDLNVSDSYGTMSADSIYFIQNGVNTLSETLDKLVLSGMNFDSDIDTLINLGWDIASDFSKIGIEGLSVTMQPESGAVHIQATAHVNNLGSVMNADLDSSYDYASTHLSAKGDFSTTVDMSSGTNVYSNSFTTEGIIKVDNVFNYLYALEYSDAAQYVLFTRDDSAYQMGFVMRGSEIKGGDSYGVVTDFFMDESYDTLNNMQIRNTDKNPLGIYNQSEDRLQVIFADGVKEYLYLY